MRLHTASNRDLGKDLSLGKPVTRYASSHRRDNISRYDRGLAKVITMSAQWAKTLASPIAAYRSLAVVLQTVEKGEESPFRRRQRGEDDGLHQGYGRCRVEYRTARRRSFLSELSVTG